LLGFTIYNALNVKENIAITENKTPLKGVSETVITSVLKQLKTFEDKQQFLDNNITLDVLAKKCNTNSSYLSKIINYC